MDRLQVLKLIQMIITNKKVEKQWKNATILNMETFEFAADYKDAVNLIGELIEECGDHE